jgi:hypothetical protein
LKTLEKTQSELSGVGIIFVIIFTKLDDYITNEIIISIYFIVSTIMFIAFSKSVLLGGFVPKLLPKTEVSTE